MSLSRHRASEPPRLRDSETPTIVMGRPANIRRPPGAAAALRSTMSAGIGLIAHALDTAGGERHRGQREEGGTLSGTALIFCLAVFRRPQC